MQKQQALKLAWTAVAAFAVMLAAASPAAADIKINEFDSDAPGGASDWVELYNTGPAAVNIGGYLLKDEGENNTITIPAGETLGAGAFFATDVTGDGNGDTVRLFNGATLLDSYNYQGHPGVTWGRCPNGTGEFVDTAAATRGAANSCPPVPAETWPGGTDISVLDAADAFPVNLSGLAYQPSGTRAKGFLWGVRNDPATLYKIVPSGALWTVSFSLSLRYPDGLNPDSEGVTLADGDPNGVYVSIERNDGGSSQPGVLRYDVTGAGPDLTATNWWNLTADLPGLGANAGLEAIGFMSDSFLVAKGLIDESKGAAYNPADYPGHGSGLFFVGVEQDGRVIAYALKSDNSYTKIATIASGFPAVMDLTFEPETGYLWAACDNTCDGKTATLEITQSGPNKGKFAVTHTYARPTGMVIDYNNEGFAIAPQLECVNGLKPTFYADDSDQGGHSLRGGTKACTVIPDINPPGGGAGDPTPTP
jgi:lamin tail-like protein